MHQHFPLTNLLDRVRQRIRVVGCGIYLVFVVFYFIQSYINPVPDQPMFLEDIHFWCAVNAVIYIVLGRKRGAENLWFDGILMGVFALLIIFNVNSFIVSKDYAKFLQFPAWMAVVIMSFFIMLGKNFGAFMSGVVVVSVAGLVVFHEMPMSALDNWPFAIFVVIWMSVLSYAMMSFHDENVNLHKDAHEKLDATRLDALTGVFGRATLEEELYNAAEYAKSNNTALSIIVTDIDNFKSVNDTHGHNTGDEVLRDFAKCVRRAARTSGGIVGRWGGEEFLILLPRQARPEALAVAERIRTSVCRSSLAGLSVTASFGVASYRGDGDELDALFERADERLYEAKDAGRNIVRG